METTNEERADVEASNGEPRTWHSELWASALLLADGSRQVRERQQQRDPDPRERPE